MKSKRMQVSSGNSSAVFCSVIFLIVVGLLVFGLSTGVVTGASDDLGGVQDGSLQTDQEASQICGRNPEPLITSYNNHLEEVPGFFRFALSNQEIHTIIHNDTQGNYTFHTGSGGVIESYEAGTTASTSVRVITSCESFRRILTAGDPVSEFRSEYRKDRVKIVGIGLLNFLLIEALKHPVLAGGISLLLILIAVALVYYYVRRRRMVQGGFVYGDDGSE